MTGQVRSLLGVSGILVIALVGVSQWAEAVAQYRQYPGQLGAIAELVDDSEQEIVPVLRGVVADRKRT